MQQNRDQQPGGQQQRGNQPQGSQQQDASRQQQQFDAQRGQQSGGAGIDSSFADQIRPHMEVCGPDNEQIGIVDHMDGDQIKLARDESGQHSYLPLSQVAGVDGNRVLMRERGDTTFGLGSES